MIGKQILFVFLSSFLIFFAGCDKKTSSTPQKMIIICERSYIHPAKELAVDFTKKTLIPAEITAVGESEIMAMVKIGKTGDILIAHDPFLDHISNANALAGDAHAGFKSAPDVRIHVIGLNYSDHSLEVMQFIEYAREKATEIFKKHGFE